jgi:glycosyltransferase involved in cell wall biosynthesis
VTAPTLSVVIPVHDDAVELRECLRLLAAGTVLADEIVIVDNASTDDLAGVAREFGARVVTEPVLGIPLTRSPAPVGSMTSRSCCVPSPGWSTSARTLP